jgi:hypothetical protein
MQLIIWFRLFLFVKGVDESYGAGAALLQDCFYIKTMWIRLRNTFFKLLIKKKLPAWRLESLCNCVHLS